MPIIPAAQEAEIGSQFEASPRQIVRETLSRKNPSQKGLVEWLKVKALSSNPSATKINK
jgi:hypothetical protein